MTALAKNAGNLGIATLFNEDHYTATSVINPRVDSITISNPTAVTIIAKVDCPLAYLETARTYTSTIVGAPTGYTASGSGALLDTLTMPAGSKVIYVTTSTYDTTPQNQQNDSIPFATTTPIVSVTEITQDGTAVTDPDLVEVPLRPVILGTATVAGPFFGGARTPNVYQIVSGLTARLTDANAQRVMDWIEQGGTLKDLIDGASGKPKLNYSTSFPVLDANTYPNGASVSYAGAQWHTAGRIWLPYGQNDPSYSLKFFTDFLNTSQLDELVATASGTGAAKAAVAGTASHPGVISLSTGTTATGYTCLSTDTNAFVLAGGTVIYETTVQVPVLSAVAEEYIFRAGLFDLNTAVTPVNGVYFTYDRLTSAKWYVNTATASTRTTTATTLADVAAATWYRLRLEVNPAGTSVAYYVNDVLAGTVTTNIPTVALGAGTHIIKSAGTTARLAYADTFLLAQSFTTAR